MGAAKGPLAEAAETVPNGDAAAVHTAAIGTSTGGAAATLRVNPFELTRA